jgi:dihydroxyacid dehydratase/phosphogluconate dehydratase
MSDEFSAILSEEDLQEIQQAIALLNRKMPFLIHLSADERRRLYKMGDKSLAFVSNSITVVQTNPEILPASFNIEEFKRDYQLAIALTEIQIQLSQLTEKVDDTLLSVGSDAMSNSLTIYEYVKTAAKRVPGLKSLAEQLSQRFKAMRARAPKPEGNGGAIAS